MKKLFTFAMAVMTSLSLWAVEDDINEYVNNNANYMGVLSNTRWCDHNIGTTSSMEYGNYYQWGNIHVQGSYNAASYGNMYETINTTDIAGWYSAPNCWDVAMCYGETWIKSLTMVQWQELIDNCTWKWSDDDKVYYVTGPSGTTIVLPAAGYKDGRKAIHAGTDGYYWTTTRNEQNTKEAYCVHFNKDKIEIIPMDRAYGLSVRPGIPGFIFDEEADTNPVPLGQYNVFASLKTSFEEDVWRPICVPFTINQEDGHCNLLDIVSKVAVFKGIKDGVAQFETLEIGNGIVCGTPYLVLPASGYNSTMGNRLINGEGTVGAVTEGTATYQGTYTKKVIPAGAYIFDGKNFVKSNGELEAKANTAYLAITESNMPETLACAIDGKVLDENLAGVEMQQSDIKVNVYNLQGMLIRTAVKQHKALNGLQHGVYIINGKKVCK